MDLDRRSPRVQESDTLQLLRGIRLRGTINAVLILLLLLAMGLYGVSQDQRHKARISANEARVTILEAWKRTEMEFREKWRSSFSRWLSRQPRPEEHNAPGQIPTEATQAPSATGP